jgi:hypothetical protein
MCTTIANEKNVRIILILVRIDDEALQELYMSQDLVSKDYAPTNRRHQRKTTGNSR